MITGTLTSNQLILDGVLRDGALHRAGFKIVGGAKAGTEGDELVGTCDDEGWWYKTKLVGDTGLYRQTRGSGYKWETRNVPGPTTAVASL